MTAARLLPATLVIAAALGAFAWRLCGIADRPMHCDEAVHAAKLGELIEGRALAYDPSEYHGPTLHYLTLPGTRLHGAHTLAELTEGDLRVVPLFFSLASVLALLLLADGLGPTATVCAAVLASVSPILAYYSRYYIQESLLSCALLLTVAAGWRYSRAPSVLWAAILGASLGFAFATKETCVLHWTALGLGVAFVSPRTVLRRVRPAHVVVAALVGLAVAALFLTSLFRHPTGLADAVRSYFFYADRAGGQGHEKPWFYYLNLLLGAYPTARVGPETLTLGLAFCGACAAALCARTRRDRLAPFLSVCALALLIVHSAIPYKTPWLMLGFVQINVPLAGLGMAFLLDRARRIRCRWLLIPLLLAAAIAQGRQCHRLCTRYAADERNPYAYSHTSTDLLRLVRNLHDAAAQAPEGADTLVQVVTPEYWPLPWYLRDLARVGYWHDPPPDTELAAASMVVTTPELDPVISARLRGDYQRDFAGLRPGFILSALIRQDLWERMVAARR